MKIIVKWERDGDEVPFEYPPFMMSEGKLFMALTGQHPAAFPRLLDERDLPTLQFAVWLACQRNDIEPPAEHVSDIEFDLLEFNVRIELSEEEKARIEAEKAADPEVPTTSDGEGSGTGSLL